MRKTITLFILILLLPLLVSCKPKIKSLEDFYGIKIFKRNGRELLLSIDGELLVKNARRLYALNNKIKSEIELSLKKLKQLIKLVTLLRWKKVKF